MKGSSTRSSTRKTGASLPRDTDPIVPFTQAAEAKVADVRHMVDNGPTSANVFFPRSVKDEEFVNELRELMERYTCGNRPMLCLISDDVEIAMWPKQNEGKRPFLSAKVSTRTRRDT